jgi:hypothetical protein
MTKYIQDPSPKSEKLVNAIQQFDQVKIYVPNILEVLIVRDQVVVDIGIYPHTNIFTKEVTERQVCLVVLSKVAWLVQVFEDGMEVIGFWYNEFLDQWSTKKDGIFIAAGVMACLNEPKYHYRLERIEDKLRFKSLN